MSGAQTEMAGALAAPGLTRLTAWLGEHVPGWTGTARLEPISGGRSNPTFILRSDGAPETYVLRRRPAGILLPSAHAVDREYRVLSALGTAGFAVPEAIAFCDDPGILGTTFYVMRHVAGRMLWDGTMPGLLPIERTAHYRSLVASLADLHSVDWEAAGLAGFGKPGNYFGRQLDRWTRQYRASQTEHVERIERLIDILPLSLPEQGSTTVIHGDYRLDNVLFASAAPTIVAVLDWELSTLGDPLADFAYLAMNWVLPIDGQAGLEGADLSRLGIPSLDDIVAQYCARTGRDGLPELDWLFAYNMFRLIGIIQGVVARAAAGNAASADADELAARLPTLADRACYYAGRAQAGQTRR